MKDHVKKKLPTVFFRGNTVLIRAATFSHYKTNSRSVSLKLLDHFWGRKPYKLSKTPTLGNVPNKSIKVIILDIFCERNQFYIAVGKYCTKDQS